MVNPSFENAATISFIKPETPHNYEGSSAIIIGIKNFLRLAAFYAFHAYIG